MQMLPGNFEASNACLIDDALTAVREHLGMPVAYLSRWEDERMEFRNVSAPGLEALIKPGDDILLRESYCPSVIKGDLPQLIPDTSEVALCADFAITRDVPIRSHVTLPITLEDGSIYGTFCCLSPEPNPTLNDRDLAVMSTFASLVTREVQREIAVTAEQERIKSHVTAAISNTAFHPVFQPLVDLQQDRILGIEALTRFDGGGTEEMFQSAAAVGLGIDLELATLNAALEAAAPVGDRLYISVNASPELICDQRLCDLLSRHTAHRFVVEITERSLAENETTFLEQIGRLQQGGIRIAIDDVGAGYSGLQRISQLGPDILKIDRSIVCALDAAPTQRAVVAALVHLARETDCQVLAEGIETQAEAEVLRELGVELGQGWLYGRPVGVDEIVAAHLGAAPARSAAD